MALTLTQLEARRQKGQIVLVRDIHPGLKVQVTDNSGLDSRKVGTIVRERLDKTDGWYHGLCSSWETDRGRYTHAVSIRTEEGSLISMFVNRLKYA